MSVDRDICALLSQIYFDPSCSFLLFIYQRLNFQNWVSMQYVCLQKLFLSLFCSIGDWMCHLHRDFLQSNAQYRQWDSKKGFSYAYSWSHGRCDKWKSEKKNYPDKLVVMETYPQRLGIYWVWCLWGAQKILQSYSQHFTSLHSLRLVTFFVFIKNKIKALHWNYHQYHEVFWASASCFCVCLSLR